ncbi:hypothetical protein FRC12_002791 [Ceratobasidium sp. 428]|nr:hypothetical protein FRC12_002791 [Ceratobasidium sp. 428]
MVRVLRVISTIDLLEEELRERLATLYACILTFDPPGLDGREDIHRTWDDTSHALKPMSRIIIRGETLVSGVSAEYADGSQSNAYGKGKHEHVFSLSCGEHISDVVICEDPWSTHAIQFVTTRGRVSPFYGGGYGGRNILSCDDGVLAGFIGRMKIWQELDAVARVQTIWRRDIPRVPHTPSGKQAIYIRVRFINTIKNVFINRFMVEAGSSRFRKATPRDVPDLDLRDSMPVYVVAGGFLIDLLVQEANSGRLDKLL